MTSLKKSSRQWPFLGQEVTSLEDLTPTHIRVVYGLGPNTEAEQTGATREKNVSDRSNVPFPYCGNRYAKSGLESSESTKGNSTCTAARCKDGNPHCLNYMGQDQWEKEDALDRYLGMIAIKPNPELLKRPVDTPAGMKNLGATCYANSLLQVWFHDLAFRDAIYRCRFSGDADNSMILQLVYGKNRQSAPKSAGLLFQGHYSYNTTCKNCLRTSARECTFYELMLNIKDNCTLMDCLEEFVEPEELVGADRNNKWFVLNDEEVTEFHGTRFDPEDYSEADSKAKIKKTAVKGDDEAEKLLNTLSSRNAYMLTYVKRASELPNRPSSPPNETLKLVQQDNAKLEIEIKEYEE
ncbi:hypothetical protein BGX26_002476 [Mortierella sp. AD094]|nr:hypothetical protein BGX26_002476 [Mortierella sp. AD094]